MNAIDRRALELLRCPLTHELLAVVGDNLQTVSGEHIFKITKDGIPLFAVEFSSPDGKAQRAHYNKVGSGYLRQLYYPQTEEYLAHFDMVLSTLVTDTNNRRQTTDLGTVAELCCGRGEAMRLFGHNMQRGVGVDVSEAMLATARTENAKDNLLFVQGDASMLPLASESFDNVFILSGIHHINQRRKLFDEVARILKPGGRFYFREPVDDFFLWRWVRACVYRISPALDHETEKPVRWKDTVPVMRESGLRCIHWRTYGLIGGGLFMNSDVLVFNRIFRFVPGIRWIARNSARLDDALTRMPGLQHAGLIALGCAEKVAPATKTSEAPAIRGMADGGLDR